MPADTPAPNVDSASTGMTLDMQDIQTNTTGPELILSSWDKPNPRYHAKFEYMLIILTTIQYVKI